MSEGEVGDKGDALHLFVMVGDEAGVVGKRAHARELGKRFRLHHHAVDLRMIRQVAVNGAGERRHVFRRDRAAGLHPEHVTVELCVQPEYLLSQTAAPKKRSGAVKTAASGTCPAPDLWSGRGGAYLRK